MKRVLIVLLGALAFGLPPAVIRGGDAGEGDAEAAAPESARPPLVVTPRGNFTLAQGRAFDEFAVYFVGSSFEGHELKAVVRRKEARRARVPVRVNYVQFLYGTCEIPAAADGRYHGGCVPPLAVQVWPACERYQALYPFEPDEALTIRSVSAAFYEGHRRLELYTGFSTVVLFGRGRADLLRAATELEGVNVDVDVGASLPAEEPGAQSGRLTCS